MKCHLKDPGKGGLFVFEGADGVGKTELSKRLLASIEADGFNAQYLAFPGHEPKTVGGLVYDIHHTPLSRGISTVNPTALQILHVAAHADSIIRVIHPLLSQGTIVLLDRFWWSTWVYGIQSGVSELALRRMISLEKALWGPVRPSIIWMVTRKAPLRPENMDWRTIQAQYLKIAKREATRMRVQIVHNDNSIDSSLRILHDAFVKIQSQKETYD
ncbi:MAG: hypothetical protein NTV15_01145 [Candidatus Bathyarchaeota archaeon]|nr:hypothetical protein [Candidatus Bathyarchaeota archaeon]